MAFLLDALLVPLGRKAWEEEIACVALVRLVLSLRHISWLDLPLQPPWCRERRWVAGELGKREGGVCRYLPSKLPRLSYSQVKLFFCATRVFFRFVVCSPSELAALQSHSPGICRLGLAKVQGGKAAGEKSVTGALFHWEARAGML